MWNNVLKSEIFLAIPFSSGTFRVHWPALWQIFNAQRILSNVDFFFARRPIGPCNLVLFVHHRLMRGEKSVHDSRIGAEPFVHCETWDILVKITKDKIWIMDEKQQQKTRAGPARNPGTPRPGARRHGKGKNQPNNNMIQSSTLRLYTLDCLMP